ncbi:MAG: heavy metal translocating P-type ATPase [Myxococcota bacterium]
MTALPAQDPASECLHCGLPVPIGLRRPEGVEQFCCSGCETVYQLLHSNGLEQFYALRGIESDGGQPARVSGRKYQEFDDPTFTERYVTALPTGRQRIELYLEGVHCAGCVWLVERLPALVPGVTAARLNMARGLARIEHDPTLAPLSEVAGFIDKLGYTPHPYRSVAEDQLRRAEDRRFMIRMAVAFAAAGNIMLMAAALYSGDFHGMAASYREFFRWGSLALAIPTVFYSAAPFFRGAWSSLILRRAHMDLPIALGLLVGFLSGAVNTIRGTGEIYFDSVASLVFLLLAGRYVQRKQQRAAADAAELRHSLTPLHARRIVNGRREDVPIMAIGQGDVLEVRAGELVPADGRVLSGTSSVDEALLTGESKPQSVRRGAHVHAGTLNLTGTLTFETAATGVDTRVGKLMAQVEDSRQRKADIVGQADRIAGVFVCTVIVLALIALAVGAQTSWSEGMERAIALLIISCPCALGLATPLAITAALGRAARQGLLIKGGDALEKLSGDPLTFVFDKTGTLTRGRLELLAWYGDPVLKDLVAGIEAHSTHAAAQALVGASAAPREIPASAVESAIGGGVKAQVDGDAVAIGSSRFIEGCGATRPSWVTLAVDTLLDRGVSPVLIAVNNKVRAVAGLGDAIRDDALPVLRALRARGHITHLLTGDHPEIAAAVGKALEFTPATVHGGVSPEEKHAFVQSHERVVMVGDGVNDAAALADADVGIAVQGGAEASLAAADIFATAEGIVPVLDCLDGAGRTLRVIRRNLAVSLGYNVVGVSLAIAGVVGPLLAAVLMPLSSITVVISSYRSRTFQPETPN